MSGPIESTGLALFAGAAFCVALFVVPLAKPKPTPEQAPPPPAFERLTDTAPVSQAVPVIAPAPPPPAETKDERLMILEESVNEIKRDQQELKDEIRALVREIKTK